MPSAVRESDQAEGPLSLANAAVSWTHPPRMRNGAGCLFRPHYG